MLCTVAAAVMAWVMEEQTVLRSTIKYLWGEKEGYCQGWEIEICKSKTSRIWLG